MFIFLFVTASWKTTYHYKEQEKSFRLIYNSRVNFFRLSSWAKPSFSHLPNNLKNSILKLALEI